MDREWELLWQGKAFGCNGEIRKLFRRWDKTCQKKRIVPPPVPKFAAPYKGGWIVGWQDGNNGHKIFFSPDGENLSGGGKTRPLYNAGQSLTAITPFKGGVLNAFHQGGIYFSENVDKLGGKLGAGKQLYFDPRYTVEQMCVVEGKVQTYFAAKAGSGLNDPGWYCSPDGSNPGGGNAEDSMCAPYVACSEIWKP